MLQPKIINLVHLLIVICLFFSCSKNDTILDATIENETIENEIVTNPNILLVIADDMGLDATPGYEIGSIKPNMPNLQQLINTGIRYNNVWSNPTCSPTRSTILTGKYGFKTGVLTPAHTLSTTEISLQKYIDTNLNSAYSSAVIGKWHLSNNKNHPQNIGIQFYSGFMSGALTDYYNWTLTENGVSTNATTYNTTAYTNSAISWIEKQTKPWFLWLAFNAPHTPFHVPPANLHSQGNLSADDASINANPLPYYLASLEAIDTEFGRLLNSLTQSERANTIIIFIGDNGTPNQVAQEYNTKRVKGSLYQGGINVPMIIAGKNVTRINETDNSLINTTDIFSTIANITGIKTETIYDSQSFIKTFTTNDSFTRKYVFSEDEFNSVIRNNTHKYMLFEDGSEAFYNLTNDPFETINLVNQNRLPLSETDQLIKNELVEQLKQLKN